jgi:acyl carrier protein
MDRTEIAAQTRRYITENFLYTRPDLRLGDDDRLLERGIIDSMGVMELVAFLQERFAVTVDEREITEEHFGSIAAIAAYVAGKHRGGGDA